jgi:hypothetical protein
MDEVLLLSGSFCLGIVTALIAIDAWRCIRRRLSAQRSDVFRGKLEIFTADGDHVLSARLPCPALERLLQDLNAGRIGTVAEHPLSDRSLGVPSNGRGTVLKVD